MTKSLTDLINYLKDRIKECDKRKAFDKDYKWDYVKGAHEKTLLLALEVQANDSMQRAIKT